MAEDCENTPLLADQNKPLDPHNEDDDRPLDNVQLLLLSYARMMEPITVRKSLRLRFQDPSLT